MKKLNIKPVSVALLAAFGMAGAVSASVLAETLAQPIVLAKTSNPCAAKSPCAAKNNSCNPCVAKTPCAVKNPCAAKSPRAAKNPCTAKSSCNPCAAKSPYAAKNPCAAKETKKSGGGALNAWLILFFSTLVGFRKFVTRRK